MTESEDRRRALALAPPVIDPSITISAVTDVGTMYLHRDDEVITPAILSNGHWRPEQGAFLRSVLSPGSIFLDIGANIGYFSLLASAAVGPSGRVFAVEPEPRNVDLIRANAWQNRAWNVRALALAANAETGYGERRLTTGRGDTHRIADASEHPDMLVPSVRLDDLLKGERIDVVRLGVYGLAQEIVEGLSGVIADNPDIVLLCELRSSHEDEQESEARGQLERWEEFGLRVGFINAAGSVSPATEENIDAACAVLADETVSVALSRTAGVDPSWRLLGPAAEQPVGAPSGRWDPIFYAGWERVIPDRSMWPGPNDPVAHFLRWPFEYMAYLTLLCDLKRDDSVLEIGCNHGRTMLALLDYLRPPGRYEGLDILAPHIAYAREHIEATAPNFRFTLADVHNDAYNPTGTVDASGYRFPYDDGSFDCAYAASLYTHLLPDAATNYLRQTRRVLKPGAKALYSFFVLDFYGGPGTSAHPLYEFDGRIPNTEGVGVRDVKIPGAVIAYKRDYLDHMAGEAGLRLSRVIPGYWSAQGNYAVNEQDLVVLEAV